MISQSIGTNTANRGYTTGTILLIYKRNKKIMAKSKQAGYRCSKREFGRYLKKLRSSRWEDFPATMRSTYLDISLDAVPKGVERKSLRVVAQIMGISKNTLHDYEQGKRYPPAEFVYDYCAALGFSPNQMINKWVYYHPNFNVRRYRKFGNINRFFTNSNGHYLGYKRRNVVRFIGKAIKTGIRLGGVRGLSNSEIGTVAVVASTIIDKTLADGLAPHPKSIEYSMTFDEISDELQKQIDASMKEERKAIRANADLDLVVEYDELSEMYDKLETELEDLKTVVEIMQRQGSFNF